MDKLFERIEELLKPTPEEISEGWAELFRDMNKGKEFTGDRTPNKVTPKKSNTGEEQGQMHIKFVIDKKDPKRMLLKYRHYDDPRQWSSYGYLTLDDPTQYRKAMNKFIADKAQKSVRVFGTTEFKD